MDGVFGTDKPVCAEESKPTRTLTSQDGHLMSQSEQLNLQRSATTKAEGEQRSENGKICDHADKGMAVPRKYSAFLGLSEF